MKKILLVLAITAGLTSIAGNAKAAIVYNSNPNFVQTGSYFNTYNMLANPSPNGAGFYLVQSAAQAAKQYGPMPWMQFPAQPASSSLSAFSNDFFKLTTLGEVISASPSSANQLTLSNGEQYVGFNLIDSLNSNSKYYGWMSVTVSGVGTMGNVQFALNSYAYDNTGSSITVGNTGTAVPEPSAYALFGLGALALVVMYRRRNGCKATAGPVKAA